MRENFYESIINALSNVVYNVYGDVIFYINDDDKEATEVKVVVYDVNPEEFKKLKEEDKERYIVENETYNIIDLDFDNEFSVYMKINEIVRDFEIKLYDRKE